jgi:hypothetical protein
MLPLSGPKQPRHETYLSRSALGVVGHIHAARIEYSRFFNLTAELRVWSHSVQNAHSMWRRCGRLLSDVSSHAKLCTSQGFAGVAVFGAVRILVCKVCALRAIWTASFHILPISIKWTFVRFFSYSRLNKWKPIDKVFHSPIENFNAPALLDSPPSPLSSTSIDKVSVVSPTVTHPQDLHTSAAYILRVPRRRGDNSGC